MGDQWVLFGGASYSDQRNATFTLSLGASQVWSELAPGGVVPGVREGAAAVYDRLRSRMVIFGGYGGVAGYKIDVRALDLANPEWSFVTVDGTPPSLRSHSSAIYDSRRDRLVLFGGRDGTSNSNQVWTVDFSGTPTWTLLATVGTPPDPRHAAGAVYDSISDRMIVYGGIGSSGELNDTWELALDTKGWHELVPGADGPPSRAWFGTAYDSNRRRILIFGGQGERRDVWALPLDAPG